MRGSKGGGWGGGGGKWAQLWRTKLSFRMPPPPITSHAHLDRHCQLQRGRLRALPCRMVVQDQLARVHEIATRLLQRLLARFQGHRESGREPLRDAVSLHGFPCRQRLLRSIGPHGRKESLRGFRDGSINLHGLSHRAFSPGRLWHSNYDPGTSAHLGHTNGGLPAHHHE